MAEMARICRVSRARVSQIMRLLELPPGVQEELLAGRLAVTEREVRRDGETKWTIPTSRGGH